MTRFKSKLTREKKAETRQYALMLLPFFLLFTVFTVVPVISSIVLSFTDFNMLEAPHFIGAENYIRLFVEDEIFIKAVRNTLVFAVLTGPLSYFLALLLAWMVNEFPRWLRSFLTLIFYAPSIAGNVYFIWQYIFSSDSYGLANSVLMQAGFITEPIKWLTDPAYTLKVIMVVQLWLSLGVGFLSLLAGFQSIDRSIYEAGAVDGIRNRFQELVYLTLPAMGPQLMFAAVMQISTSFGVGAVCTALAGFPSTDYSAHTVVLHMQDYGTLRYQMGYASAVATVLFVAMIAVNHLVKKILAKYM